MSFRLIPCLIVALVVLGVPREAAADRLGFWRWWDSLSGPGPFYGWDYELPLHTWGFRKAPEDTAQASVFFDPTGLEYDPRHVYVTVGFEVAVMWTDRSDLTYPPGVEPPKVYAFPIVGTIDVGKRGLEGGVGIGSLRLSGPDTGKWYGIFEPRLTVKPFVLAAGDSPKRWHEVLQARVYVTRVGGIVPSDFGAVGDVKGDGEWVPGVALSVNVLAMSWFTR